MPTMESKMMDRAVSAFGGALSKEQVSELNALIQKVVETERQIYEVRWANEQARLQLADFLLEITQKEG